MEHLWEKIREKWFGNLVFRDMKGVEDTLAAALECDTERIGSLAGFDWIISISLNAT